MIGNKKGKEKQYKVVFSASLSFNGYNKKEVLEGVRDLLQGLACGEYPMDEVFYEPDFKVVSITEK